jgi:quercetin dioxygenase-like cupin family protein
MTPVKEIIRLGQLELRFLLDGEDTNNQLVMFEFIVPAAAKVPVPHYHLEVDEVIYGLEGTLSSIVNGEHITINPGNKCFIPRGAVHYHDNLGDKDAKVLCVLTPASIGPQYFRDLKAMMVPGTPPDPKQAAEIMIKHGLIPVVDKPAQ